MHFKNFNFKRIPRIPNNIIAIEIYLPVDMFVSHKFFYVALVV